MKTKNFISAINSSVIFIDVFGDNLGGDKLTDIVKISSTEKKVITVVNKFGTVKNFSKEELGPVCDEISNCLESFKSNYPGYVRAQWSLNGNKRTLTLSSTIFLNGTKSVRRKEACISIVGREISVEYQISESFTELIS